MKIVLDVKEEDFLAQGNRTVSPGWHVYYEPYIRLEEVELPDLKIGDSVNVTKIDKLDKETQPPKRYTESSIIRELEKRNLGTKATRADILDRLFKRGYISDKQLKATQLGMETVTVLEKYSPEILDEELTRHFEEDMEDIRAGKRKEEGILKEAKEIIEKILKKFKTQEKKIGKELAAANIETRDEMSWLGECPKCKKGELHLRRGKYGTFAACNKYPDCKTTYSLPSNAIIKPAKKDCPECTMPMVLAIKKAKRPQELCMNKDCKTKNIEGEAGKEAKVIKRSELL